MILFNLLINLLEGVILSVFIANYFELKNKWKYTVIMGIIVAIEINISNAINEFDWILIFAEIATLCFSLVLEKKKLFTSFFICVFINIILLCCNGIALFITSFIFKISISKLTLDYNPHLFCVAIALSKILLIIMLVYLCRNKLKIGVELKFKQWWMFVVIIFMLLLISIIILEVIMLKDFKFFTMVVALVLIVITIGLVILLYYKTNIDNERLIDIATKINNARYKEKNFKLLSTVNRDMENILHNSKYFLLLLKNEIKDKNYESIEILVNKRMEEILKSQTLLNTGNLLFDYNFNYNLRKYNLKSKNIKFMISLDKIDFFEEAKLIDFVNELLYSIDSDSKERHISFEMHNTTQFIVIKLIIKNDADLMQYWNKKLELLKNNMYYNFDIKEYDNFITITIVIPISTDE